MKPEFDNTWEGGFTRCRRNIRKGGYLLMMVDYKGGKGSQEFGKK